MKTFPHLNLRRHCTLRRPLRARTARCPLGGEAARGAINHGAEDSTWPCHDCQFNVNDPDATLGSS